MSSDDAINATVLLADDQLVNVLAAGAPADHDPLAALLTAWRAELEHATPTTAPTRPATEQPSIIPASGRHPRRLTRRAVAALTAAALVGGGGVAAAAVSGPHGPLGALHRILFGDPSTT